jgi:hypothetical protein
MMVPTYAYAHHQPPEDQHANNGHGGRIGGEGLRKGGKDHDDQLQTVHALPTDLVSQPSKDQLADDVPSGGRYLDGGIRIGGDLAGILAADLLPKGHAQHGGGQVDGEQIIGIGEETNASDDDGTDMSPAERSIVDLGEGLATALIGIQRVRDVVGDAGRGRHLYFFFFFVAGWRTEITDANYTGCSCSLRFPRLIWRPFLLFFPCFHSFSVLHAMVDR